VGQKKNIEFGDGTLATSYEYLPQTLPTSLQLNKNQNVHWMDTWDRITISKGVDSDICFTGYIYIYIYQMKLVRAQIQDYRKFTQPALKYLLMVAVQYSSTGLINTP
jgi:hypothetical protein